MHIFFVFCTAATIMDAPSVINAVCVCANVYSCVRIFLWPYYGGWMPYGDVDVYKKDNDLIFVTWTDNRMTLSKAIKLNRVIIMNDHTYVEESRKNFVFLPKELYAVIKEDNQKVGTDSKE